MLSKGVARLYPGIIATGDVRRGRDTKLVVARNRWFESISLQRRVRLSTGISPPRSRSRAFRANVQATESAETGMAGRRALLATNVSAGPKFQYRGAGDGSKLIAASCR